MTMQTKYGMLFIYLYRQKRNKNKYKNAIKSFINQSRSQDKFSLTIDIFYYIHFFRKVHEKTQNEKIKVKKVIYLWVLHFLISLRRLHIKKLVVNRDTLQIPGHRR